MAKDKNIELIRVNVNLPTSLVNRVKEYAEKLGINTTSAYIILLNQALDQKQTTDILPTLFEAYNEFKAMKENDKIDNFPY